MDPMASLMGTPPGAEEAAPVAPEMVEEVGLDDALSKLIAGIIKDQALDTQQKKDKIIIALGLMEDPDAVKPSVLGGSAQKDEVPAPEAEEAPGGDEGGDEGNPFDKKKKDDEMDEAVKKALATIEEAATKAVEKVTGVVDLIEAKLKVKAPVSLPPAPPSDKQLTVDMLLEGFNTKGK